MVGEIFISFKADLFSLVNAVLFVKIMVGKFLMRLISYFLPVIPRQIWQSLLHLHTLRITTYSPQIEIN